MVVSGAYIVVAAIMAIFWLVVSVQFFQDRFIKYGQELSKTLSEKGCWVSREWVVMSLVGLVYMVVVSSSYGLTTLALWIIMYYMGLPIIV